MAASIKAALGVDAHVVAGSRGQFDVVADGALLFSKQTEQRFSGTRRDCRRPAGASHGAGSAIAADRLAV